MKPLWIGRSYALHRFTTAWIPRRRWLAGNYCTIFISHGFSYSY